jgi:hypothetical protein
MGTAGGQLYHTDEGREVWRIRDTEGRVVAENIESDHDAAWLAEQYGVRL